MKKTTDIVKELADQLDTQKVEIHAEPEGEPKHPGGRPSEYTEGHLEQLRRYLECFRDFDDVVPTIESFSFRFGIGKPTIYRWEKDHDEFRNALDSLRSLQASLLINKGLEGKFAPVITKLMLSANHGMAEKSGVELSGKDGAPIESNLTVTFVNAAPSS